jgi:hypothetical protein
MSDRDPTTEQRPPDEGEPEEYSTLAGTRWEHPEPADESAFVDDDIGGDEEWASEGPARGVRLALPVAGMLSIVFIAAGFWGGATIEKNRNGSTGTASALAARFGRTGTAGGTGGFPFGGGATSASSGTTGTLSVVNGNTLYVLTSTGALTKVMLSPSTTITRNADTKPDGLRPGDTVSVQGATSANGNVTATSITATAPGVSSRTAGFGLGAATPSTTTSGATPATAGG